MFIILYIILAAASAGWAYWDRLNDKHVDHEFDELYAICIGVFFPVTIPFAVPFSHLRKMKEKRDKK